MMIPLSNVLWSLLITVNLVAMATGMLMWVAVQSSENETTWQRWFWRVILLTVFLPVLVLSAVWAGIASLMARR